MSHVGLISHDSGVTHFRTYFLAQLRHIHVLHVSFVHPAVWHGKSARSGSQRTWCGARLFIFCELVVWHGAM